MTVRGVAALLTLLAVSACGFIKPGTLGHEPPSAGRYNPVSGEINGP